MSDDLPERPEWVACIRQTGDRENWLTWCGRGSSGWDFQSIDHAVYAAQAGQRVVPCRECFAKISSIINKVWEGQ